jgi:hypothetical protein
MKEHDEKSKTVVFSKEKEIFSNDKTDRINEIDKIKDNSFHRLNLERSKNKFFGVVFNDTNLLFKLLYHKYFINDLYKEVKTTNIKKFLDLKFQNEMKIKLNENLIYPTKELCERKFSKEKMIIKSDDDLKEFEIEKKSKEYLEEYIKIYKYSWMSNLTTICFFAFLGASCVLFNYHKKNKRMTPRMFLAIGTQLFINTTCLYFHFRSHPDEVFLKEIYADELEKYKKIYKE